MTDTGSENVSLTTQNCIALHSLRDMGITIACLTNTWPHRCISKRTTENQDCGCRRVELVTGGDEQRPHPQPCPGWRPSAASVSTLRSPHTPLAWSDWSRHTLQTFAASGAYVTFPRRRSLCPEIPRGTKFLDNRIKTFELTDGVLRSEGILYIKTVLR